MRAVITNFGTTGDFLPLLTLARELARRHDQPVLAFPPFAQGMVRESGFEYQAIGPDLSSLRDGVNQGWSESDGIYDSSDETLLLLLPFRDAFDQVFSQLQVVCQNADVLVSGPAQPMARMIHEIIGIPFVSVQFSHFGGNGGPGLRNAGEQLINPFRKKMGLPAIKEPFTQGANSPQLALYAMSPCLRPRPEDWPAHYCMTGFFMEAPNSGWRPNVELQNFVSSSPSPVVISFGSMVHSDSKKLVSILVDALQLTGQRAVIQGMPRECRPERKTADIYWTDFVPHSWLFPHASCIVSHGGAGTAAATFHSGIPGIFVPHGNCYDQRYWAQLAEDLGCCVPAIQYADLGPEKLASAIEKTINSSAIRNAAAKLSVEIRREQGVVQAAELIHDLVERIGLRH